LVVQSQIEWATEQYAQLAEKHGLSLTQMALAFIKQQFFVTSTIIGVTRALAGRAPFLNLPVK
jgi:aryl-alcohol dehydrogenase-like predicted oxidoreductase